MTEEKIGGLTIVHNGPVEVNQPLSLTASITTGSNPVYIWALGDGSVGSGATVTHAYDAAEDYIVTVIATNTVSSMAAMTIVQVFSPSINIWPGGALSLDTLQELPVAEQVEWGDSLGAPVIPVSMIRMYAPPANREGMQAEIPLEDAPAPDSPAPDAPTQNIPFVIINQGATIAWDGPQPGQMRSNLVYNPVINLVRLPWIHRAAE